MGQSDLASIKKLLSKVGSEIPEIQVRSINSIYTKLEHNLITQQTLNVLPQFPGLLMTWINDHKQRSDTLYKVIYILSKYTQFQEGLLLLRQYECLEFCEDFRKYLFLNERNVDSFLKKLDYIIEQLLPLGRADQLTSHSQVTEEHSQAEMAIQQHKQRKSEIESKDQLVLKFEVCAHSVSESCQKQIFDLAIALKYANKDTLFTTLCEIRQFLIYYHQYHFRCKADLFHELIGIALQNIFPEICCQCCELILHGIRRTVGVCERKNRLINLHELKTLSVPLHEIELKIVRKLWTVPESFAVIEEILMLKEQSKIQDSQQLLQVTYAANPWYYARMLSLFSIKDLQQSFSLIIDNVQNYSLRFPQCKKSFLKVLPEQVCLKINALRNFKQKSQGKKGYKKLHPYLGQKFQICSHLHDIRSILRDMEEGIEGVSLEPQKCSKLFFDVLLCLAISVSRQDPLMSYYPHAKELASKIIKNNSEKVGIGFYERILLSLESGFKISYGGSYEDSSKVVQMVLSDVGFVLEIFQLSLDSGKMMELMLRIIHNLSLSGKFHSFVKVVPIIFCLTYHQSESVAILSKQILSKIPKKYQLSSIALKLFCKDQSARMKVLTELTLSQTGSDLCMKAHERMNKKSTKKELKISMESVRNYFNIIFNPELEEMVKCGAADELIGYVERMSSENLVVEDFRDFYEFLQKKVNENASDEQTCPLSEKLIELFWMLSRRLNLPTNAFTLDLLLFYLCRATSQSSLTAIFCLIYEKVFQSPFCLQAAKNWSMDLFPHIEVFQFQTEPPLVDRIPDHATTVERQEKQNVGVSRNWMDEVIEILIQGYQIDSPILYKFEEEVASAVADLNPKKISKMALVLSKANRKVLEKLEGNSGNLIEHVLSKKKITMALQYDLLRMLKALNVKNSKFGVQTLEKYESISLPHLMLAINTSNVLISGKIVQKVIKGCDQHDNHTIYLCLLKSKIDWSKIDEYSCLRIIESIVKNLRHQVFDKQLRVLALGLLIHLTSSSFPIKDHKASITALLRVLIFDHTLTLSQFCMCMDEINLLMSSIAAEQGVFLKQLFSKVQSLLSSLLNKGKQNLLLISCCFSFISCLIRTLLVEEQGSLLREVGSRDVASIVTYFLSSYVLSAHDYSAHGIIMIQVACQLLYLWVQVDSNLGTQFLLNSTNILPVLLTAIETSMQHQKGLKQSKMWVSMLNSIGRLLHLLAHQVDDFIFKLNSLLKSDSFLLKKSSLQRTLCSPLRIFIANAKNHTQKGFDIGYINAILWVLLIWSPNQRQALEDEGLLVEIIECCSSLQCFQLLRGLATVSKNLQKMIVSHHGLTHLLRKWSNEVDSRIVEQAKDKKNIGVSLRMDGSGVSEGVKFLASLFTVIEQGQGVEGELSAVGKQNLNACLRLVDKLNSLKLLKNEENRKWWQKLLQNIFMNELSSKPLCSLISQGSFSVATQIVSRSLKMSPCNLEENKESLLTLGKMGANETMRSLIFKHRLIEELNTHLIQMEENKVAKYNYSYIYAVASFFHHLSIYKDSNAKILTEKRMLNFWAKVLSLQQTTTVEEKVLDLLINLASYKHNKPIFMGCQDIHKVCLGLLSEEKYELKGKILSLLYNVLYKNAAGAKIYRRKEVMKLLQDEVEGNHEVAEALIEILTNEEG